MRRFTGVGIDCQNVTMQNGFPQRVKQANVTRYWPDTGTPVFQTNVNNRYTMLLPSGYLCRARVAKDSCRKEKTLCLLLLMLCSAFFYTAVNIYSEEDMLMGLQMIQVGHPPPTWLCVGLDIKVMSPVFLRFLHAA
jgi:hypothetical protein